MEAVEQYRDGNTVKALELLRDAEGDMRKIVSILWSRNVLSNLTRDRPICGAWMSRL